MDVKRVFTQWPFRRKLLLFLLIIFLPAFGIILSSGLSHRKDEIVRARNSALLLTQSLAAQQEQVAITTKTMLSTLANMPEVQSLDAPACNRIFHELHQLYPFYSSILAMTPDGYVFAAHTPLGDDSVNQSDRKYFQDAISSLDFSAGEYIIGRVSKTISLNYSFPVLDANKKLVAVLTAGLNLHEFGRFISEVNLPEGSVVAFTDHQGVRLFRWPQHEATAVGQPVLPGFLEEISGGLLGEGVFDWFASDGLNRIYAFKQLRLKKNSTPYLYITVGLPKDPILHKATLNMLGNLSILGIAALLSLSLAWVFGNFVLIKPIHRLVAATQQFGRGEMATRTGLPHSPDELGRLAQAFDDMASLLEIRNIERESAEEALNKAYAEMEERVQGRTAELTASTAALRVEISERKQAEEALRESEKTLRALLDANPESLVLLDNELTVITANQTAAQRFDKRLDELIGVRIYDLFPREVLNQRKPYFDEVFRTGRPVQFEDIREGINFYTYAHPVLDAAGKVSRIAILGIDITARKQAEELLQESEKHYRSLFENMLNGYAYCQMIFEDGRPVDFTYLNVNHAFEVLTGLKNVKGKRVSEVIPGLRESDPQLIETYGRVALTGIPERFEIYVESLEMWFSISVYSPQKEHFVAVFDVITERKQAEEALRQSQQKLLSIFRVAPVGIGIVFNRVIQEANETLCRMTGYSREQLVGQNARMLYPTEEDYKYVGAEKYRQIAERGTGTVETRWKRQDGEIIHLILSSTPLDATDLLKGVTFTALDITERKLAEEALRDNEQFLTDIFNNIQYGLTILDPDFNIIRVNRTIENLPFTKPIVGRKCYEVFHGHSEPCEVCPARQVFLTGQAAEKVFTAKADDGSIMFLELHAFPLVDYATGQVQRVIEYVRNVTEREQAEEALRQAEEKYRNIFENAVEGIFQSTPEGHYISANSAMARMFGYEAPEELMAEITDIKTQIYVDPQRRAEFQRLMARDGFVKDFEYQIYRQDGGDLWLSENARTVRDAKGDILYYEGFMQDISERKEAETELARLRRHQELILNSAWEGILGLDLNGHITFVNPVAARTFGYEVGELLGLDSHTAWHHSRPDGSPYPVEECQIQAALQKGEAHCGTDEVFWRKDGTSFTVKYGLAPILEHGEVIGGVLTFRDISQQKEDRALTRSLIAASPVGIYLLQDGKFALTNHWFHNITGYNEKDLSNLNFWDLVHPEDREAVRTNALKMLRGERFTPYEYRNITKGGEIKWIMETITPIQYQGKRATLGYFMDITEHKQLEEQFLHAQKMEAVGRLAGGVAHDFNNMLGAIMGYIHMIKLTLPEGDERLDHVQGIEDAAERAASLTRQLLAFSRKQVTKPVVINVNKVVSEVEKMMRHIIGEDIDLSMNLGPSLGAVKADPGQITQIIMNLAVNARDAMPAGGKLTIETANVFLSHAQVSKYPGGLPGPYVRLTVSDTGAGIDEETMPHIFEPFFTTKGVGRGTGLGLSTVFGIVQQNGGFIEVASERGLGTVFKIYFPQVQEEVEASAETSLITTLQGSETILLVEDEVLLRKLIQVELARHGYQVLSASDGAEALLLIENHKGPIDLLLTDVVMPVMSGRELAERLAPGHPKMKVLYISGYTEDAPGLKGLIDETTPFLQKPFPPIDLVRRIRQVLDLEAGSKKNNQPVSI